MKLSILLINFLLLPLFALSAQNFVKIGLLIQDVNEPSARHGAELAVKLVNEAGGINGLPVRLITKSMEGPWGTGSKQAVALIWEDEVWALLGSHDGRNAHLVEQASAKSTVPFVSAWSSDPTLSKAFIPWFFNCVPNDDQQAEALIREIFSNSKLKKVTVITDNSYDSNQALKSYLKFCELIGTSKPVVINYDNYGEKPDDLIRKIITSQCDCIVLFSGPEASLRTMRLLKEQNLNRPVLGSLLILNEDKLAERDFQELEISVKLPRGSWSGSRLLAFQKSYREVYGRKPGMVAAFAYDGMNALLEAIRISNGSDREKIEKALSGLLYEGVTGTIQFGEMGILKNGCFF